MSCTKTKRKHNWFFRRKKKKPNVKINRYIELCNRVFSDFGILSHGLAICSLKLNYSFSLVVTLIIYIYCEFPKIFT